MNDLIGIVNFEEDRVVIEGLSQYRTIPAMSILGRYRIIDFVLSNMVNSGIKNIKLLTKNKARSLIEHVGNGSQYNINSKTGSLQPLFMDHQVINDLYFTDIALLHQHIPYIQQLKENYVVIAPSYMLCDIDYREVLKQHLATGAEITCVYKEIHNGDKDFLGCQEYEIDEQTSRITDMSYSHGSVEEKNISMETYLLSKERFINIIEDAMELSSLYTFHDYLQANIKYYNMIGYNYKGYLQCVNSLKKYYQINQDMLDFNNTVQLFKKQWPVYTKTNDTTPTFYSSDAKVKNSMIANGCVIQGTVENCVIGRGVKVKKGSVVKNSILLPYSYIGADSHLEYVVVDKNARIETVKNVQGDKERIVYVHRGDKI